jgi:SNF2 family DNA or RNA helicase
MVSAGTVEVRMIERAQKKLFLDRMVNGGEGRGLNGEVREGDEDDDIARLTTKDLLDDAL